LVRLAQDFSLRIPLVQGQGNFGSVDGDPAAAMRYTEARMARISEALLRDIKKETVDFGPNYDDSMFEPLVLPSAFPNLLVNGSNGIAVGMATNMPPHNLSEVIDGTMAYIDNNDIDIKGLMEFIKAPDFPTGGIIYGYDGVISAYETGRGRIVMRGETSIEETKSGKEMIIATSLPYQVNKAEMIKKTADMVNDKKIEGISDIRDESDRDGIRVVYELKKDANTNVVLNKLYQYTALQTSFSVNNIALVHGRPVSLNLKDLILHFVDHRHDVVTRRTQYELKQAEKRAHILEGLIIASDNIDEVIKIIRASQSPDQARETLMERFELTEIQARAIVDMRLRQLTGLEQEKLRSEYEELLKTIEHLKAILESFEMRMDIIKEELLEIKEKYGDERKSQIEFSAADFRIEDTIPDDDVVITISHAGYIKRTNLTEYRRQNRGGRGAKGSSTRSEDFLEHLFVASMHDYMLFFTEQGKVFWLRVFEIPEGTRVTKGRAIQNIINISSDDRVRAYINTKDLKDEEYVNNNFIILATKKGIIKKTSLEAYSRPRTNGINAITVRDGDELLEARLTNGENEVIMAVKSGRAIRFNERHVRPMGRNASGVRGIKLDNDKDEVVGMICLENHDYDILVVSEKGYGKRSKLEDYRETNRGGKGVRTLNVTEKTGDLITIKNVTDENDLMIINKSGILIRIPVGGETNPIRVMGRNTQGVRLIKIQEGDHIASVAKVEIEEEEVENGTEFENDTPDTEENES